MDIQIGSLVRNKYGEIGEVKEIYRKGGSIIIELNIFGNSFVERKVFLPEDILETLNRHSFDCINYKPSRLCSLPNTLSEIDTEALAVQFYFDEFSSFNTVRESIGSSLFLIKNLPNHLWRKFKNINLIGIS